MGASQDGDGCNFRLLVFVPAICVCFSATVEPLLRHAEGACICVFFKVVFNKIIKSNLYESLKLLFLLLYDNVLAMSDGRRTFMSWPFLVLATQLFLFSLGVFKNL